MTTKMSDSIVFLDFDGVIVTFASCCAANDVDEDMILPVLVRRVQEICDRTGAKVVISSSWRLMADNCIKYLRNKGLVAEVIGTTPQCNSYYPHTGGSASAPRGAEILTWLWSAKMCGRNIQNYVILDDEIDAGFGHDGHFVQCSLAEGLTSEKMENAIEILLSCRVV